MKEIGSYSVPPDVEPSEVHIYYARRFMGRATGCAHDARQMAEWAARAMSRALRGSPQRLSREDRARVRAAVRAGREAERLMREAFECLDGASSLR